MTVAPTASPRHLPPDSPLSSFQIEVELSRHTPIHANIGHRPFATKISPEHPLIEYSSRETVNNHVRKTWPKDRIELQQGRQLFVDNFLMRGGELPKGLSRAWHQAKWIEDLNTLSISLCVTFDKSHTKKQDGTGIGAEFPGVQGKVFMDPKETFEGWPHITLR